MSVSDDLRKKAAGKFPAAFSVSAFASPHLSDRIVLFSHDLENVLQLGRSKSLGQGYRTTKGHVSIVKLDVSVRLQSGTCSRTVSER